MSKFNKENYKEPKELTLDECVEELLRHLNAITMMGGNIMAIRPEVLTRVMQDYERLRKMESHAESR